MLHHLQIKDLVIVRSLALTLEPGMSALTGETGAGKSILIEALGLALGEKAEKSMIRNGCDAAEISASFDLAINEPARILLREQELESDDACILRRVVTRSGRSRAFINDRPVTLQQLKELGELLIDIHGQHEHQSLVRTSSQRQLLDAYAGHRELAASVAQVYQAYDQSLKTLQQLQAEVETRNQRLDYLEFQIDELSRLDLHADELEQLATEQRQLAHAEQLAADSEILNNLLFDSDSAVLPVLSKTCLMTQDLLKLDPTLDEMNGLLENARIQVEESAALLRDYQNRITVDPERLSAVDQRLAHIQDLARKHHLRPEMLPGRLETLQTEKAQLENADTALTELEQKSNALLKRYLLLSEQLSASRKTAAKRLSGEITESMQQLGMEGGLFEIECLQSDKKAASRWGLDTIGFLVSANPGQPLAPLAKVASGGELSRISLAIQVATAGYGEIPTLIFDEVDSGIGGAVAEIVGRLLRKLGEQRQVLCVTHLPQVAAQGHQQMLVSKTTDGQLTETRITALDHETREQEIARMLGGMKITEQTLSHAREMILHAQQK